ncbi:MAG: SpoIIE family protein phosphatase [Treponema sp.]|jgi:serine phosphatase RsbU (regulator of sigma subunit)|nr:SpoIIE family protein phosphatase [Treponema sp.]
MIKKNRAILFFLLCRAAQVCALSDFYWEQPDFFSPDGGSPGGSFPVTAFNGGVAVVAWQENTGGPVGEDDGGQIAVSVAVKRSGENWRVRRGVGGPYAYSGSEPALLSAAVDAQGRIVLAAAASIADTELLVSGDGGETFDRVRIRSGAESSVAPRVYPREGGGYLLFATRGSNQTLSIYYARSENGLSWTSFEPFVTEQSMQLNFLPTHAGLRGIDYVVFQSFVGGVDATPTFQLYLKTSSDGGRTWTAASRITRFQDPLVPAVDPDRFDNQRPHLSAQDSRLFLAWERSYGANNPQIYGAFLNEDGEAAMVERINTETAHCNNPIAFSFRGETTALWFDSRRGENRVFLAQRRGLNWENYDLSGVTGEAFFARPVVDGRDLLVFWQNRAGNASRVYALLPDTTAASPRLAAENFVPSRRSGADRVRVSWDIPVDPSGIQGFSYCWDRSPEALPPRQIMAYVETTSREEIADEDGNWYFFVMAQDFAGNWSAPSVIEYIRDTTPPPSAAIIPPLLDEEGFLPSNTFSLRWNPPPASDIAGYTWALEHIAPLGEYASMEENSFLASAAERFGAAPAPFPQIMGRDNAASFSNADDGVWRFSVFAVDEVGNIGPASSLFFRMNKYVPRTFITLADAVQDEQGTLSIRVIGRGFLDGGAVSRVFIERESPAAAKEFFLENGDYRVASDREIVGLRIDDIEEGMYRIGLEHPLRGIVRSAPVISVDNRGTVKFGDFSRPWKPKWTERPERRHRFNVTVAIMTGIVLLCGLGAAASLWGIASVVADNAAIQREVAALITGDSMPLEKKKRLIVIKRRRIGLRLKLASYTIALMLLVVVMVSVPLYRLMTRTQEETLLQSLRDRSAVLMEGIASSARAYFPSRNVLEMGFLPAQMAAIPEAQYVSITGYGSANTTFADHLWATNDPDILSKIDTADFEPGVSRLQDELSPLIEKLAADLNERARAEVGVLNASIASLTREGLALGLHDDPESIRQFQDIQETTRGLEIRLTDRLTGIAREIRSEPSFPAQRVDVSAGTSFLFYKPVMFRQGSEDLYFRGLIRLEVSIDSIIEQISERQRSLLRVLMIVALTAIVIGIAGALTLSALIIRPIKRLASHVERIRDTEDKAKLEGVEITLKTRDELAVLGNTINDMTHGLVMAAKASEDLTIGKEVQKKFIPLETDREGNKLSSGFKDTKNAHFFGYYEGAKGVSGDYFDYQDLDGRYFAVIKCDVAGKGIPAALIMIQVATMFLNYFKAWRPTEKGMHIEEAVYQINDFIETLGFKGRFAAFTLALFDSETGVVRFCNAGDNIVHLYDASEKKMKTLTLRQTPATGALPNSLVESRGGYQTQTVTIDRGDMLLLYTDGIEEAKRKFRDSRFHEILCPGGMEDGESAPPGTPHANHAVGQGDEELGADRVEAIVNAVMNQQVYTLYKHHNPEGEIELQFDFRSCSGTVEEAIMAMVSVEKMFRLYRDPAAGADSRVLVDKKIDHFLREHFRQYRSYCSQSREAPGVEGYRYYTHVKEDEQYDDLTILGIRRK